jgi:hypothetical protein
MILAIDPGHKQSAYCVWDGQWLKEFGILENEAFLNELKFLAAPGGTVLETVLIEMVASYGMAVGKEVFETVFFIGRLWERLDTPKQLVYRKDVKMHLCHSMRAKDANIRQALIDRFGPPGTKNSKGLLYGVSKDVWSAVAIAVYWWDTHQGIERRGIDWEG